MAKKEEYLRQVSLPPCSYSALSYHVATLLVALSVWGQEFLCCRFLCLNWCLLKSMIESYLLFKDELLALNIDEVMAVGIFRRRAQNTKIGKHWTPCFRFLFFLGPQKRNPFKPSFPRITKAPVLGKSGTNQFTSCSEKMLKSAQPISQVNLAQCTLCWQFDDQKDMDLALRGFSLIQRGHFYDAEAFLTIRNLVPPCNPYHRTKLLFHPKWTVSTYSWIAFPGDAHE